MGLTYFRMLENRVVLVTGAASGIGREIAERFAREGARVTGFDRAGDVAIHGDVRSPADVERAVDQVVESEGRIDVLVNSAGVREIGDVYTMATEEWDNVIAVNLSGTFYCCQAAARRMRESGGGVIVNISSVGGLIGLARRPAYTAAKHGVDRADEEPRPRPRPGRDPGQRDLPRPDPDTADRAVLRRGGVRGGTADRRPAGPRWSRGRRGRCCALPRERPVRVRERRRAHGRRRLAGGEELRGGRSR